MLYLERWYKTMSPTGDFQLAITEVGNHLNVMCRYIKTCSLLLSSSLDREIVI